MVQRTLILRLLAASAVSVAATAAFADPPARVGRIAYVEGDVSFQPPQETDWTWAPVNFPVTWGEAFWTGDSGRVELQAGGVEARLDSETEVDIASLRYGEMRLGLAQGSMNLSVRGAPVGGVTVTTPAGDVRIDGRGSYRVDVGAPQDDGSYPPVEVTVFEGQAEAPGPSGYAPVTPGEAAMLYAGYDPQIQAAEDTAIDDWSRERLRFERREAYTPLPEGMTGVEDLGGYGDFVSTPEFGTVWFPRDTPPDWAPYRFGRWAYVAPWGYTWIDDQPWGFAPFHYGRWALVDGRWGWIPGQPTAEPIYSPALVAFFGVGAALGWAPLAPDEVYDPPYVVSDAYYRRANVANVSTTTFNTVVVNRTVTNVTIANYRNAPAVTVIGTDAFRNGAAVRQAMAPVSREILARSPQARPGDLAPPPPHAALRLAPAGGVARPVAPPPARLAAVRAAVTAPSAAANHPPAIAGARPAPPPPPTSGAPARPLIAPAQAHNPAAQHRQPPPEAGPPHTPPAEHPREPAPTPPPPPSPMEAAHPAAPPPAPHPTPQPPQPPAHRPPPSPPRTTPSPGQPQTEAQAQRKAKEAAAKKAGAQAPEPGGAPH